MAFTEQELNIAKQVKEQGGTRDDFIEILQQMREQRPSAVEVEEAPVETPDAVVSEQLATPVPTETPQLSLGKLTDIAQQAQAREQEKEEGLKGFISETGEALGKRFGTLQDIATRGKEQKEAQIKDLLATAKQEGVGSAIKKGLTQLATPDIFEEGKEDIGLQATGQVVAGALDVIWEGVENLVQEFTTEEVEKGLEDTVAGIAGTDTVQSLIESYQGFKERNPEKARNLEGALNIAQILPIGKLGKVVTKPITKTGQAATKKTAEQGVKDMSRALLNIPGKLKPADELKLGKFFASKVDPTDSFDDVAEQFVKIGSDAIDKVNTSLKSSTSLHKPQGAKEVLLAIKDNLKNIPFATNQKKAVNDLLKKFNKEGLTLTDLNNIKRSINEYTRAWTAAGKDAAGLAPDAMRGKYSEIKKLIENVAKKEGLPDIKDLNNDWIQSDALFDLLSKQATAVGKKKGLEALTKSNLLERSLETVFDIGTMPLKKVLGKQKKVADMKLSDALQIIKNTAATIDKKPILEGLGSKVQVTGKEALESLKKKGLIEAEKAADKVADKTGSRLRAIQERGKSLDDFGDDFGDDLAEMIGKSSNEKEFIANYFKNKSPIFTPSGLGVHRVGLKDIIKNKKLYEKYPNLKHADIMLSNGLSESSFVKGTAKNKASIFIGKRGWENVVDETKKIKIEKKMDDLIKSGKPDDLIEKDFLKLEKQLDELQPIGRRLNEDGLRALNHELEHAKQELKGVRFATQDGTLTFDEYFNLPEEVSARAAETKFIKTQEQLKKAFKELKKK